MVLRILNLYRWQIMLKITNCFQAKIKSTGVFKKHGLKMRWGCDYKNPLLKPQNDQRRCLRTLRQRTSFKGVKGLLHGSWVSQLNNRAFKMLRMLPLSFLRGQKQICGCGFVKWSEPINTCKVFLKKYISRSTANLNLKAKIEHKGKRCYCIP